MEVAVVAEPGRVDGGQRARLGGEGGGESAQGAVEQSYAFGVGAHEQRVLCVGGVPGRRGRLHTAPAADGTEGRLPQGLPAATAEGAEETGGEEGAPTRACGRPKASEAVSVAVACCW